MLLEPSGDLLGHHIIAERLRWQLEEKLSARNSGIILGSKLYHLYEGRFLNHTSIISTVSKPIKSDFAVALRLEIEQRGLSHVEVESRRHQFDQILSVCSYWCPLGRVIITFFQKNLLALVFFWCLFLYII